MEKKYNIRDLEKYANLYENLVSKIKSMQEKQKEYRSVCTEVLDAIKTDVADVLPVDDTVLRVQRITKHTINYDEKALYELAKKKGIAGKIFNLKVDSSALDDAYNEGLLTYDEIQSCVKDVDERKELRIQRVKK